MSTMEERQTYRAIQDMARSLDKIAKALDHIADHMDDIASRGRLSATQTVDRQPPLS